jgi:DnaK suppressor protein
MGTKASTRHSDLKRILEERRRTILDGVLSGIRQASEDSSLARAGDVRDAGDEGEAMLQDAVRFTLISMKTELAGKIDQALERLAEGSYGACDDCGADIAESRLRAMPFAVRCRRCEESREGAERERLFGPKGRNWRMGELANW